MDGKGLIKEIQRPKVIQFTYFITLSKTSILLFHMMLGKKTTHKISHKGGKYKYLIELNLEKNPFLCPLQAAV